MTQPESDVAPVDDAALDVTGPEFGDHRLAQDHANAAALARGLGQIAEISVTRQATNMVFLQIPQRRCAPLGDYLKERGILIQALYGTRLVTHLDISAADIDAVVATMKSYFANSNA